jgi:hypothetical protein
MQSRKSESMPAIGARVLYRRLVIHDGV